MNLYIKYINFCSVFYIYTKKIIHQILIKVIFFQIYYFLSFYKLQKHNSGFS